MFKKENDELGIRRYYGLYSGIIESTDDPEKNYRIYVKIPEIYGDDFLEHWAEPFAIPIGYNMGILTAIKKGDRVRIMFENGDPSFPIWTYAGGLKDDKIDTFNKEYNKNLVIASRAGTEFLIDDINKKIELNLKNGKSIIIEQEKIKLGKNANHPVAKGDITVTILNTLCDIVTLLSTTCISTTYISTALIPSAMNPANIPQYTAINTQITTLKQAIDNIKSLISDTE